MPAPAERGSYDLPAVVTAWVAYLSRERTGSDTFAAAKLDFWRARASREQHEADELAGNLLAKEEVRRVLGEMAVELGAALNRLAVREKNGTRRSYGASWPSHDGMTIAELSWKADIANSCDQSFNGRATFAMLEGFYLGAAALAIGFAFRRAVDRYLDEGDPRRQPPNRGRRKAFILK